MDAVVGHDLARFGMAGSSIAVVNVNNLLDREYVASCSRPTAVSGAQNVRSLQRQPSVSILLGTAAVPVLQVGRDAGKPHSSIPPLRCEASRLRVPGRTLYTLSR